MSQPTCRYYNKPGGCRFGDRCRFYHPSANSTNTNPANGNHNSPSQSTRAMHSQSNVPLGACRVYWASGSCRHEFNCRFRHISPSSSSTPSLGQSALQPSGQIQDELAPFLTQAGMAKLLGTGGADSFFTPSTKPLSPNEAHNALKRFLYDDFRFNKPTDVYAFMIPLNSASSNNALWSLEDGQLLLSALAAGNGLLRVDDIIRWPDVNIAPGNVQILSFHRGYLPLLRFLASDFVIKSALSHLINALYSRILENLDQVYETIDRCFTEALAAGSFNDPSHRQAPSPVGHQVIVALSAIFFECLSRFRNAIVVYPKLSLLVQNLHGWSATWISGITSVPPTVKDSLCSVASATRDHIVAHLQSKLDRLLAIVDREAGRVRVAQHKKTITLLPIVASSEGILAALHASYEGPGEFRPLGPRHDNDFVDIHDIRVAPTNQELISRIPPFLPGNIYGAPHPYPEQSMSQLLDIQFRLLREELTAPLRTAIQLVCDDMQKGLRAKTTLSEILKKGGGKYRASGPESIMFNLYVNVEFLALVPDRRGLSTSFAFSAPPGRARSPISAIRCAFWEGMSGKRMMQGGLVALVWKHGLDVRIHLGILSSSTKDLTASAKQNQDRVVARVVFFDPEVELQILHSLKHPGLDGDEVKLLVEAPVMFEAIRPFLEALRVEPESIPFSRYLPHQPANHLSSINISPPRYATAPKFRYQLASLFPAEAAVDSLLLDVTSVNSIETARRELRRSRLDPSQAESVVDALTRELVLIQGPPGTGKSFTGVELLRVLIANRVKPILLIAFTNHALDHMLCSVLDAGITSKIVRLGSRSANERISQYSIETMELVTGQSRLHRTFATQHRTLRTVEEEMKTLLKNVLKTHISSEEAEQFLSLHYPAHFEQILTPPRWILTVKEVQDIQTEGWQRVDKNGRHEEIEDNTVYSFWKAGRDLDFLQNPTPPSQSMPTTSELSSTNMFAVLDSDAAFKYNMPEEAIMDNPGDDPLLTEDDWQHAFDDDDDDDAPLESTMRGDYADDAKTAFPQGGESARPISDVIHVSDFEDPSLFFDSYGSGRPLLPITDRPLGLLLEDEEIWQMSLIERQRLDLYWTEELRKIAHETQIQDFKSLRYRHEKILEEYTEGQHEIRRQLLQNVDIVGCTTTGAAKLTSLLKGLDLRVMMVEEAGQVLEAHVLGSLVPSIEHLILIGDPLQLRPTLNNYNLSMDSRRGSQIFRFDMSLMERLATAGLPMSRIDVQRRMRPAISNLVRRTLYPILEDHEIVKNYPPIRGLAKNVYFLTHNNRENSQGDESASKYNTYEVAMIRDLVLYLLRQGCYSQDGDIVVLCAYLGQLARVRDALSGAVTVVIDERDQAELADREDNSNSDDPVDSSTEVEVVKVIKRVRLRTVDNYQGEEAKIVILSLVRNAGGIDDFEEDCISSARPSIGFLKSENRTNVALSRAREGLYILGNAALLASRSRMWHEVLNELESQDAIGNGLPVACSRHPEYEQYITEPGQLSRVAPDGGCLRACAFRLECGHVCPYKCHPDDPNHVTVKCTQLCRRLCPRGHPCDKQCSDDCGQCKFPVLDVSLPCGHISPSVPCHLMGDLSEVPCNVMVEKDLPDCEHMATMTCSMNPAQYVCKKACGGTMACCGRTCKSSCYECQEVCRGEPPIFMSEGCRRQKHKKHLCDKPLHCAHRCVEACSQDHQHTNFCKGQCRQECAHTRCKKPCSTPCAPCQELCTWRCPHYVCPVPCGSICTRLPCNLRCKTILKCGHRCPSVCGEECDIQICRICADQHTRQQVVDMVLYRTLEDLDPNQESLDELTITLPKCHHVFTVETLDGHCHMSEFYAQDEVGNWKSLQSPNHSERKTPPVCPTCRIPITSPRYGRVFKRADLDILERNIIGQMTQSLTKVQEALDHMDKTEMQHLLQEAAANIKQISLVPQSNEQRRHQITQRRKLLHGDYTIIPVEALDPSNISLHGISGEIGRLWKKATSRLSDVHRQLCTITGTRSPHIHAWEAAFSFLYEQEMESVSADPSNAPRRPREYALRVARMKVGQPQPRADKRFVIEGIWLALKIRFIMIELAQTWHDATNFPGKRYPPDEKRKWAMFISFLLESCARDGKMALKIAQESEAHRQITTTTLFIMRAELDKFRFKVEMLKRSENWQEKRETLVDAAEKQIKEARSFFLSTLHEIPGQESMQDIRARFSTTGATIIDEWEKLASSVRYDHFYSPVSLDEKIAIVRALDFGYTGHFYNCPNGHTFVITECGGAMERSTCPECGAPIGGSNHTLESTNTRATEYEELASREGAQRSLWAW